MAVTILWLNTDTETQTSSWVISGLVHYSTCIALGFFSQLDTALSALISTSLWPAIPSLHAHLLGKLPSRLGSLTWQTASMLHPPSPVPVCRASILLFFSDFKASFGGQLLHCVWTNVPPGPSLSDSDGSVPVMHPQPGQTWVRADYSEILLNVWFPIGFISQFWWHNNDFLPFPSHYHFTIEE